jgi:hypothetical protein
MTMDRNAAARERPLARVAGVIVQLQERMGSITNGPAQPRIGSIARTCVGNRGAYFFLGAGSSATGGSVRR